MNDEFNTGPSDMDSSTDLDINIRNTGQRVRVILILVIAVVGGVGAIYYYNQRSAEIQRHEDVRAAFQSAHMKGYVAFWDESEIDVKDMKSNAEFAGRVKQILSDDALRYGKHLAEKAVPLLDEAMPNYKAIEADPAYGVEMDQAIAAYTKMRDAWKSFSNQLLGFEQYYKARPKLKESGNQWLGAQQSPDKKYITQGNNYLKLVQCILLGKAIVFEVPGEELRNKVEDSCMNDQADWFARVANECMPQLLRTDTKSDDVFEQTINAYVKADEMDPSSVFGVETCLKDTYEAWQDQSIETLGLAWAEYSKSKNALKSAIDAKLEEVR